MSKKNNAGVALAALLSANPGTLPVMGFSTLVAVTAATPAKAACPVPNTGNCVDPPPADPAAPTPNITLNQPTATATGTGTADSNSRSDANATGGSAVANGGAADAKSDAHSTSDASMTNNGSLNPTATASTGATTGVNGSVSPTQTLNQTYKQVHQAPALAVPPGSVGITTPFGGVVVPFNQQKGVAMTFATNAINSGVNSDNCEVTGTLVNNGLRVGKKANKYVAGADIEEVSKAQVCAEAHRQVVTTALQPSNLTDTYRPAAAPLVGGAALPPAATPLTAAPEQNCKHYKIVPGLGRVCG